MAGRRRLRLPTWAAGIAAAARPGRPGRAGRAPVTAPIRPPEPVSAGIRRGSGEHRPMAGQRSSDFAGVRDMPEQGFRSWSLGGLPIIASPAEIDIANAHELREALLAGGDTDHATVVL